MVPVEAKPVLGGNRLAAVVSISTPMAPSTPVLAMKPLFRTKLLELIRTAAVLAVEMPTPPVESMVMLPLSVVVTAVLVLVVMVVSARAVAMPAVSKAAAAAESIKRCLVNATSLIISLDAGGPHVGICLFAGSTWTPPPGTSPLGPGH